MPKPVKIRFAQLLPMAGEPFGPGELIVADGKIREVSRAPIEPFDGAVIDLSDCLLMPGFVNAHCHLSLSALRGKVPKCEKFTEWIKQVVRENHATPWEARTAALREAAGEMSRSGVTALADYLSHPELLAEYKTLPFRQVAFLETFGFKSAQAQTAVDKVRAVLETHLTEGARFKLGLAPHAPYSISPALFKALKALASRYSCPMSAHVAEFPEEVRFLKDASGDLRDLLEWREVYDETWTPPGASPVRYLDSLGVLDSLLAVHLNHVDGDLDLLESRKVAGVFCPGSARWFGRTRHLPARQFLDRGMAVGLGTDSLASNESLNFFRELRLAEEMLPGVKRGEILYMATRGGAEAVGIKTGAVAPGLPADLIALRAPGPAPESWTDLPFAPGRREADFVMLDGKTVFQK